jgi:predicted nucleic acid-binding protein
MRATVVDASAVASVLFDEPEAAPVVASIAGRLIAPSLLRYEVANVCVVKALRDPASAQAIDRAHGLLGRLDLEWRDPHWDALPALARRWHLTAYDAAYLELALRLRTRLVTLDARLAAAYDAATASR